MSDSGITMNIIDDNKLSHGRSIASYCYKTNQQCDTDCNDYKVIKQIGQSIK